MTHKDGYFVADAPKFRSAIPVLPKPPADTKVWLVDVSGQSKVLIKADYEAGVVAEIAVPFGRSRRYNPDVLLAGVRPREWLLIGRSTAVGQMMSELSPEGHVAVVDYTHSRAMVRIVGPKSVGTLEKLCSVDFSQDMFPEQGVVGARVAGVNCDIVRDDISDLDEDDTLVSFLILFDRSYGVYMAGAIFDAMSEFVV